MKNFSFIKTTAVTASAFIMIFMLSPLFTYAAADEVSDNNNNNQEVMIKGTVIQADDVCGVIVEDNIYMIPCDQVNGFNEKRVAVVGMVSQEGDVQSIYATQVKSVE